MACLLPPPSLPKRLLRCPFEPIALTLTLTSLLSIWTSYTLLNPDAKLTFGSSTPAAPTTTVNLSCITIATATSTPTDTLRTSISINETAIQEVLEEYSQRKLERMNDLIKSEILNPLCSEWDRNIKDWNDSLSLLMETKTNDYNSFLSFKNNIAAQFQQESSTINETLNLLSRTALTVGQVNGQELAQNMSIKYWVIDDLFTKFTSDMEKLDSLFKDAVIPNVSCPEFSLRPGNVSAALTNATTSFTTALRKINESSNQSINQTLSMKATTSAPQSDESPKALRKRCQALTLLTCFVYLTTVIVLCIYEMLRFMLEKSIFNLHMADMLEQCVIQNESLGEIKLQQMVRSTTGELIFSINEATVYKFCNFIHSAEGEFSSKWPRLSATYWWMWSSGKTLWILILYTIVQYQMLSSIIQIHQHSATAESQSVPLIKSVATSRIPATLDPTSIYLETLEACEHFEKTIRSTLIASTDTYLAELINSTVNEINSNMNRQVTTFDMTSWQNITCDHSFTTPTPESIDDEVLLIYAIFSRGINPSVSVTTATTQTLSSQVSKKIDTNSLTNDYPSTSWRAIYQWALIALILAAITHHLLGLIVLNSL